MSDERKEVVWGANTPAWLRNVLKDRPALRVAVDECLSEQARPTDLSMCSQANLVIERLTWEELEALVDQGGV